MTFDTYGKIPVSLGNEVIVPRLRSLLEKGSKRSLIMITGAAGVGKTTLAAWYARMLSNRPGWVVRWVSAAQLETPADLGAAFPNDVAGLRDQVLIAVDDAHLLRGGAIAGYLNSLAQSAPDNFHLMVVGRENPGVRMHRLRLEDRAVEIGREDLTFGNDEVAKFFAERQIRLDADQVRVIASATNGWAAGLQMLALLAREASDPSRVLSDPASGIPWIGDFLREEVLPDLDAEALDFVRRTCALDYFNRDLCQRVTGNKATARIIERLVDLNLIVAAPAEGGKSRSWLRYHPLFVGCLRQSMFADLSVEETAEVARRAVAWFEDEGCYKLAIKTALSCGDYDYAFDLVTEHLYPVLTSVDSSTLPAWMEEFPYPDEKDQHLYYLINAWANFISGKTKRAGMWLRRAEECADVTDPSDHRGMGSIYRTVKVGVMTFSGEYEKAVELGAMALDNLGGPQLFLRCTIMHNMGEALLRMGRYREAREYLFRARVNAEISGRRAVELLCAAEIAWLQYANGEFDAASNTLMRTLATCSDEEKSSSWPVGLLYAAMGRIHMRWGETDKAGACLDKAFAILKPGRNRDGYVEARVIAAEGLMMQGRLEDAYEMLISCYEMLKLDRLPRGVNLFALVTFAENLCLLGECDRARAVLSELNAGISEHDRYYQAHSGLVESHMWLHLGEYDRAEAALERARGYIDGGGIGSFETIYGVARACTLRAQGQKAEALAVMAKTMDRAKGESHVASFIWPLPYADSLLYEIAHPTGENLVVGAQRTTAKRFAQQAMRAKGDRDACAVAEPEAAGDDSRVVLSKREQEIYELLKKGKTRKQISDELGIQLNTTRTHIRNIYQKTGIHDRSLL